jgi:hypothetical protein
LRCHFALRSLFVLMKSKGAAHDDRNAPQGCGEFGSTERRRNFPSLASLPARGRAAVCAGNEVFAFAGALSAVEQRIADANLTGSP